VELRHYKEAVLDYEISQMRYCCYAILFYNFLLEYALSALKPSYPALGAQEYIL